MHHKSEAAKVKVHGRRRLLDDFFRVDEAEVSFERAEGGMSDPVRKLVLERGDAVAALVFHRETQQLLFTRQFRFATYGKGTGWLVEIMAGMVDGDEPPEAALGRELEEELGFRPEHVEPIATFFLSPGASSERVSLFYVEVSESGRVSAGGGLREENESIDVRSFSTEEARSALAEGRFADAKTLIGLQWYFARHAERTPRRKLGVRAAASAQRAPSRRRVARR